MFAMFSRGALESIGYYLIAAINIYNVVSDPSSESLKISSIIAISMLLLLGLVVIIDSVQSNISRDTIFIIRYSEFIFLILIIIYYGSMCWLIAYQYSNTQESLPLEEHLYQTYFISQSLFCKLKSSKKRAFLVVFVLQFIALSISLSAVGLFMKILHHCFMSLSFLLIVLANMCNKDEQNANEQLRKPQDSPHSQQRKKNRMDQQSDQLIEECSIQFLGYPRNQQSCLNRSICNESKIPQHALSSSFQEQGVFKTVHSIYDKRLIFPISQLDKSSKDQNNNNNTNNLEYFFSPASKAMNENEEKSCFGKSQKQVSIQFQKIEDKYKSNTQKKIDTKNSKSSILVNEQRNQTTNQGGIDSINGRRLSFELQLNNQELKVTRQLIENQLNEENKADNQNCTKIQILEVESPNLEVESNIHINIQQQQQQQPRYSLEGINPFESFRVKNIDNMDDKKSRISPTSNKKKYSVERMNSWQNIGFSSNQIRMRLHSFEKSFNQTFRERMSNGSPRIGAGVFSQQFLSAGVISGGTQEEQNLETIAMRLADCGLLVIECGNGKIIFKNQQTLDYFHQTELDSNFTDSLKIYQISDSLRMYLKDVVLRKQRLRGKGQKCIEFLERIKQLIQNPITLKKLLQEISQIFEEAQLREQVSQIQVEILRVVFSQSSETQVPKTQLIQQGSWNAACMAVSFKIRFFYSGNNNTFNPSNNNIPTCTNTVAIPGSQYSSIIQIVSSLERDLCIKKEISANLSQRMFRTLSHEFGTYMNIIGNIAESALEDERVSIELKKEYFRIIQANSLLVDNLLQDTRDFLSVLNCTLENKIEKVDLKETIFQTVELFKKQLQLKKLHFSIRIHREIKPIILSNQKFIQQILSNLISNSLKFTLQGTIKLTLSIHSPEYLKLQLADTGIGMKREECIRLAALLKNGFSDEKISPNSVGLGFGLLISNSLAKILGNPSRIQAIQFKSELQRGSKFWFLIRNSQVSDSKQSSHKLSLDSHFQSKPSMDLYSSRKESSKIAVGSLPSSRNRFFLPSNDKNHNKIIIDIQPKGDEVPFECQTGESDLTENSLSSSFTSSATESCSQKENTKEKETDEKEEHNKQSLKPNIIFNNLRPRNSQSEQHISRDIQQHQQQDIQKVVGVRQSKIMRTCIQPSKSRNEITLKTPPNSNSNSKQMNYSQKDTNNISIISNTPKPRKTNAHNNSISPSSNEYQSPRLSGSFSQKLRMDNSVVINSKILLMKNKVRHTIIPKQVTPILTSQHVPLQQLQQFNSFSSKSSVVRGAPRRNLSMHDSSVAITPVSGISGNPKSQAFLKVPVNSNQQIGINNNIPKPKQIFNGQKQRSNRKVLLTCIERGSFPFLGFKSEKVLAQEDQRTSVLVLPSPAGKHIASSKYLEERIIEEPNEEDPKGLYQNNPNTISSTIPAIQLENQTNNNINVEPQNNPSKNNIINNIPFDDPPELKPFSAALKRDKQSDISSFSSQSDFLSSGSSVYHSDEYSDFSFGENISIDDLEAILIPNTHHHQQQQDILELSRIVIDKREPGRLSKVGNKLQNHNSNYQPPNHPIEITSPIIARHMDQPIDSPETFQHKPLVCFDIPHFSHYTQQNTSNNSFQINNNNNINNSYNSNSNNSSHSNSQSPNFNTNSNSHSHSNSHSSQKSNIYPGMKHLGEQMQRCSLADEMDGFMSSKSLHSQKSMRVSIAGMIGLKTSKQLLSSRQLMSAKKLSVEYIRQSALDILAKSAQHNGIGLIPTHELIPSDFVSAKQQQQSMQESQIHKGMKTIFSNPPRLSEMEILNKNNNGFASNNSLVSNNNNSNLNKLASNPSNQSNERQEQKKILVVDDEIFNVFALKLIFSSIGLKEHILEAYNGQQAIEILRKHGTNIGLIIMDVNMPVMNGIECAKQIRQIEKNITPIIAYTAFADSDIKAACEESGMNGFILKPSRRDDFLAVLQKHFLK